LLHVSVRSRKLNSYFTSKGRQDENLSCSRKPLRAHARRADRREYSGHGGVRVWDSQAGPGASRAQVRTALAQIRRRGWDASEGQATPGFKENLKNI
jgi:DNA-binding IclR family transcriptional regulator